MEKKLLTVAIAGCGSRGQQCYTKILTELTDRARIVAAADLDPEKLAGMRALCGVDEASCYASAEEMLQQPRLADVMFICTPDDCHYAQARAALEKGYHLLLEKPISPCADECRELAALAQEKNRIVAVCHVLRYTAFYQKIKEIMDSGRLGQIVTLQGIEMVQYWHQAHSFVRGNWRNEAESAPMILAKCCHDMDILLWLMGKHCRKVSSFGSLFHFKADQAPEGAALRCVDCPVQDCPYNAVKFYMDRVRASGDDWPQNVVAFQPTEEKILAALHTGPYGRCVYHCDNDVVDNQIVNLEFEDGSTASYTMTAFTAHGGRTLRVMGTHGEMYADMAANTIRVTRYGKEDEVIDVRTLTSDFSGHGGGDARLIRELIDLLQGAPMTPTMTAIDRSVESHLVALAAEESRKMGGAVVKIK